MKLNRQKCALIPLFVVIALAISSFDYDDSLKPDAISDAAWSDSIVAALQTSHVFQVDGEIFIVDSIPCASSAAKVGFWSRYKGSTYVDCSTCKPQSGKPDPKSEGFCTVIRKYNEYKQ